MLLLQDFDATTSYGDRRQEIVFIGVSMDEAKINAQLDGALLSDEEMVKYVVGLVVVVLVVADACWRVRG